MGDLLICLLITEATRKVLMWFGKGECSFFFLVNKIRGHRILKT
jgi:hypothetical protein